MTSEDLELIDEMLSLSPPDDRNSFIHLIEWFIGYNKNPNGDEYTVSDLLNLYAKYSAFYDFNIGDREQKFIGEKDKKIKVSDFFNTDAWKKKYAIPIRYNSEAVQFLLGPGMRIEKLRELYYVPFLNTLNEIKSHGKKTDT